jgi:hypothetical protein
MAQRPFKDWDGSQKALFVVLCLVIVSIVIPPDVHYVPLLSVQLALVWKSI